MHGCNLQTVDASQENEVPRRRMVCMDGACEVFGVVVRGGSYVSMPGSSGRHGIYWLFIGIQD
jgi:hypothetical protein